MTDDHSSNKAEINATFRADDATEVRGTVRIAPTVLIELIETTVLEIPGVIALRQRRRWRGEEAPETSGRSFDDGKVRVTVDGDQLDAEISIAVKQNTNISNLADDIRRKVGVAAGRMLGMTVRTVNIYIDDIVDPAA